MKKDYSSRLTLTDFNKIDYEGLRLKQASSVIEEDINDTNFDILGLADIMSGIICLN